MKINVISESAFTVQGHGVHTAFTETVEALREYTKFEVYKNSSLPADVLHIHTIGPYSLKKMLWSKGTKVVSAHVTPDSFVGSLLGARYWYVLAKLYLKWFYNRADAVLAVSNEVIDELKSMGVHKPIYLAPNTIKCQNFTSNKQLKRQARERLGIAQEKFVVLSCGQVQPRKRVDCFVNAAKALPDIEFIWAGGIPFKQLAADSVEMGMVMGRHSENVAFTGVLKREAILDYYRAADLFFLPSDQETFGIVIVEAAAAGLPVLLRDLEQYKDTFAGGYEKGSDDTFADIISRFSSDKAYYEHWARAAKNIADRYDARKGAERLTQVYETVLSEK